MKLNLHIVFRAFSVAALVGSLSLPVLASAKGVSSAQVSEPVFEVLAHSSPVSASVIFSDVKLNSDLLAQSSISASQAKAIALKKVKGSEVVDISRNGGVYRVRLIRKDGRVVDVFVDAKTGRVKN